MSFLFLSFQALKLLLYLSLFLWIMTMINENVIRCIFILFNQLTDCQFCFCGLLVYVIDRLKLFIQTTLRFTFSHCFLVLLIRIILSFFTLLFIFVFFLLFILLLLFILIFFIFFILTLLFIIFSIFVFIFLFSFVFLVTFFILFTLFFIRGFLFQFTFFFIFRF